MKKIYIIMGVVLLMFHPLWAGIKVVKDVDTGQEYTIFTPDIILPEITLPDILKMTIQELELVKPIQLIYVLQKATVEEIKTISPEKLKIMITRPSSIEVQMLKPEKLAIIICQIERKDLNEVLRKIDPSGYWILDQKAFYEAWQKKDIKQMAKMIEQAQKKEFSFFTAYSNYQNFDEINWDRAEKGFDCRQVLISKISYNWKEKFRPAGEIILTIDYSLTSYEIQALLEMIQENRNKIKMIVIPWSGYIVGGITSNNYENRDISTYKMIAEYFDKLAYSIREITPEIPIYLTVCFTSETMDNWIKSFEFPYDGIAVWNILTTKGNLKKVYEIISKYNKNIILSGIMQCNPDKEGWMDFNTAKEKTLQDINKIREVGFKGVILMTNEVDK